MTTQLEFETDRAGETQNAKALALLMSTPGRWVGLPHFVEYGCGYAVHSRMADLRKLGYNIENKVDRSQKPYHSFYRLTT
jgi:hypothetical protein